MSEPGLLCTGSSTPSTRAMILSVHASSYGWTARGASFMLPESWGEGSSRERHIRIGPTFRFVLPAPPSSRPSEALCLFAMNSTLAMVSRPHERRGFDPALMVLDRQAGRGNSVRRYLEHVREAVAAESRLDSTTADRAVSFAEFTAVLDQPLASCHAILAGFAHSASTADISRAFSMLLAERSPLRIRSACTCSALVRPPCSTRGCWN